MDENHLTGNGHSVNYANAQAKTKKNKQSKEGKFLFIRGEAIVKVTSSHRD